MIDRSDYDTPTLEAMPTLAQGQGDDLKAETTLDDGTPARVWLSRCGLDDGEPWDSTVSLELYLEGHWEVVQRWNGDDPVECMTPGL